MTTPISRPPTPGEVFADRLFRGATAAFAVVTVLLVGFIVWQVGSTAAPVIRSEGLRFLTETEWNASKGKFGILPQIWGTLYSSVLGVAVGSFFGLAVAVFLNEEFLPPRVNLVLKNVIQLLAAIPSVVYGLWGIFVVIPAIRPAAEWLHANVSWMPIFSTRLSGPGMLPAALVLGIMVLPTVTAISTEALAAVPHKLREAAYGLGATRWETILGVILPTASRGIYGSVILAFGRALGETMALAMLVGNTATTTWSLFSPGSTLASLIANQFPEASRLEVGALMYAALVLLLITLVVNVIGTLILQRGSKLDGVH